MKRFIGSCGVWLLLLMAAIAVWPGVALADGMDRGPSLAYAFGFAGVTLSGEFFTLADVVKELDPDGSVADVVEILAERNEILDDMLMTMANGTTSHRLTIRNSYPSGIWRKLYQGVPRTKGDSVQVDEPMGMLAARSEIDIALLELNGNSAKWRTNQDFAHIEGMSQDMADQVINGTNADPEKFPGFFDRYAAIGTDPADISYNVLDGGGTDTDNTSILLVTWGPKASYTVFPKGSKAGLQSKDLGEIDAFDSDKNPFRAVAMTYDWKLGLAVEDWRFNVRIANIDVSDLPTFGSGSDTSANLIRLMIQAVNRVPGGVLRNRAGTLRPAFYVNETVQTWLEIMANEKNNVYLSMKEFDGFEVLSFRGIPIRRVDKIGDNQATVAAV